MKGIFLMKFLKVLKTIFIMIIIFVTVSIGTFTILAVLTPSMPITASDIASTLSGLIFPGSVRPQTNALILGIDDGGLSDTIMLASFNSETGRVDLISIPRDTRIQLPAEHITKIQQAGRFVPQSGIMKFCELHSFAGPDLGPTLMKYKAEYILGIDIHYYVSLSLQAFRHVVDAVGGVYFDVPQRMHYIGYDILIDLHPGPQLLNGHNAEGLVRFRQYRDGDLGRVRMQQEFLAALMREMLQLENLFATTNAILTTTARYMDTNFPIGNVGAYLRRANRISTDNLGLNTLPGTLQNINGISFVIINTYQARQFVTNILNEGEY